MKVIIEENDGFHKSDPSARMDMLLMALERAGYQLRGKPMPSWACKPTTLLSPYQCGNNWLPIIVGQGLPRKVASNSTEEQPKGYSAQEALDHYPDPPPTKRPTLADFPNGLLGTWWAYMGNGQPGKVIHHEGEDIRLDTPTATEFLGLDWLFDAYTQVEAPEEAQDWAQFEPIMDMEEGPSAPVSVVDHHPV